MKSNFFPVAIMQQSVFNWLPRVRVHTQIIYISVLLSILCILAALPFIKVDVSIATGGIVRPVTEKTELRSMVAGTIAQILVSDGASVQKGQVLIRLQEDISNSKLTQNNFELSQREIQIKDLQTLVAGGSSLHSSLYQQQYARFRASLREQAATMEKLKLDLEMYDKLFKEKVIAKKEYLDRKYEYEKSKAAYESAIQQQRSTWATDLNQLRLDDNRLRADNQQLTKEKEWNIITAPVSGTLQQFTGKYAGGYVQTGDLLGVISPDSNMIAECYVSPRDIGYLKKGMPARFQVDAFNYNEWGMVKGKILSIDNDFVLINNQPAFKVRCQFDGTTLRTTSGVTASLKKGMTLQARFILTRRSLFQLLYDKTDDWINPNNRKGSATVAITATKN
ncbi:HlyD family secretion protein [Chitinophaga polysaccharea]|uniref:HlyD family secretion protein n=1 Tax=Chitinophaga polysaccharea TaxID=1293035 RepID=UPI001156CA91|nr:HlyD family efflux transporter periplasmic adaptor subunit [Chitinophaga polysaccharea]